MTSFSLSYLPLPSFYRKSKKDKGKERKGRKG
jgi:hypothetical protein